VGKGELADNYPVPVLIVPADRALIASLSENVFHIPMHPADEFAAFAKLIGQGKSVEDVAAAFGVTPLVVKRRMKLATVSPTLMALFREDQIGLDCLMVLASVDDHQKQEQTWAALPSWNRRPDYLRQLLTQGEIESDRDAVAKYVTLKAYEKAGGALRRDLFSDDDKKVYLLDAALLEKLATDKLQKRAKQIAAEGWKWVDVRVRYAFDEYVKYGELRKTKRQPDAEEAAALADLDGRIAALHAQMETLADEDCDEDAFYQLEGEAEGMEEQRKVLDETLTVWPADLMAQAGCVVHVGNNGGSCREVRPDPPRRPQRHGPGRPPSRRKRHRRTTGVAAVAQDPPGAFREAGALSHRPPGRRRPGRIARPPRRGAGRDHRTSGAEDFPGNDLYYCRSENVFAVSATDSQSELRSAAEDMEASAAWTKLQAERAAWAERLPENLEHLPVAARPGAGDGAAPADLRRCGHRHRHLWHRARAAKQRGVGAGLGIGHESMVDGHGGFLLQPRLQSTCPRGRHRGRRCQCRQSAGRAQEGCRGDRGGTDDGGTGWLPAVLRVQVLPTAGECSESLPGEEAEPAMAE
jgi:ParB family chromosome partitioning protein